MEVEPHDVPSPLQQVGMTSANQKMVEAALAALQGDSAAQGAEDAATVGSQQPRQQRARASSSREPEPEPEPSVDSPVTTWLAAVIADVLGIENVQEGTEQMTPVATYMLTFESPDDLAEYLSDIFEQAADEEDIEWLISSLEVQRARQESGRKLATEDELNALWEADSEALAKAEAAANAAAKSGRKRSASLSAVEPRPAPAATSSAPAPTPKDAVSQLSEMAKRFRSRVTYSSGGAVDEVFSISVKVVRDGTVLASGTGKSKAGADGMRQAAKNAAAKQALAGLPAAPPMPTEAWEEPAIDILPKDLDWMDLKPAQKKAAIVLGWKMPTWDDSDPTSACSKPWSALSQKERASATTLGYTAPGWAEDWGDLQQAASAGPGRDTVQQQQEHRPVGPQIGPQEDARLLETLKRKQTDPQYKRMQRQRQGLPAFDMKQRIIDTVAKNQVVVLSGETGCGKTTQVPQFVLDGAISAGKGSECNIICTQPRRISAMSVAERVASERTERVGATVGYSIRLEAKTSASTRMLFCTTGILLRRLSEDPELQDPPVSHIIVDEVHERSEESDFLLMVLRDLCRRRSAIHLVLMSATLNSELFQGYFGPGTPIITIPGRTHPVTEIFLEDAIDVTRHGINKSMEWARKGRQPERQDYDPVTNKRIDPRTLQDMDLTEAELGLRYGGYKSTTITALNELDHEAIDYELIRDVVMWIMETEADVNTLPKHRQGIWGKQWNAKDSEEDDIGGAILIFLPGLKEIMTALETLLEAAVFQRGNAKDWVLPLHSTLSSEEQKRIFNRPPAGTTKVVLATNIAETSITIDDVVFVIDSGRMKETRYDASRKMASLEECLVSKANAKQRAGRAGRVRPGLAIHLFTSFTGSGMPRQQLPEIQRVPLEQLCLRIKILGYGDSIQTVLNKLVEPPDPQAVRASIGSLMELQALTSHKDGEDLTALGHHLAKLPVDARIGKMLIYGAMFQCLDPVLTIAAALSYRSPFVAPLDKRKLADEAKMSFKTADSDHLTIWTAYREWNEMPSRNDKGDFCRKYFLSYKSMDTLAQMKRQFVELLSDANFAPSGLHARRIEAAGRPNSRERSGGANSKSKGGGHGAAGRKQGHTDGCAEVLSWANEQRDNVALIKSVLCAALYPNVIKITVPEGRPVRSAFDLKFHTREPTSQGGGGVPGGAGITGQKQGSKNKKKKKGGGAGSKLEQQMEQCEVFMHPTSVNGKKEVVSFGDAGFMVFLEQMETTKVYIRDCTAITAYPLLLFGGSLQVKVVGGFGMGNCNAEVSVGEGGWIRFRTTRVVASLIEQIRAAMEGLLQEKIANPRQDFGQGARAVVSAVVQLVSEEGGGVGGDQAKERPGSRLPAASGGSFESQSSENGRGAPGGAGASSSRSRGGSGGGDSGGSAGCRVKVANIPRGQANPEDIAEIFRAAGAVVSATVRVTKSKQYEGIVTMESSAAASMAVEILNGADCNGRQLRVRPA